MINFDSIIKHITLGTLPETDDEQLFVSAIREYCVANKNYLVENGSRFHANVSDLTTWEDLSKYWRKLVIAMYGYQLGAPTAEPQKPVPVSAPLKKVDSALENDARKRTLRLIHELGDDIAADLMGSWYVEMLKGRAI